MAEEFFLTTANNLEGYVIVKQCGIVFGETVFKNSALDSLGAGISNMVDSFRIKSTEMSGQLDLIEKAREFAYNKLIDQAKSRGANAVIAIDSDNTIGDGNIMYISLYGTAVKVISVTEKEEYDRKEEERKVKEAEEKRQREEARKARLEGIAAARVNGELLPEDKFLDAIEDCDRMMDVWKLWQEYGLEEAHPEINEFIYSKKEVERLYGRKDITTIKKEIHDMFNEE